MSDSQKDNNTQQTEKDEFFDEPNVPNQQSPQQSRQDGGKYDKLMRRIGAVVLALILLGVGFLAGWLVHYYSIDENIRSFVWALETTQKNYYQDIDEDAVYANADPDGGVDALFDSLESQLDAYSCFYTLEEYEAVVASGEGQNVGVGVSVYNYTVDSAQYVRVFLVVENSPAQKAGIEKGMFILGYGQTESEITAGTSSELTSFISAQTGDFCLKVGFETDGSDAMVVTVARESYQAAFCYYRDSETSYSFRGDTSTLSLTETCHPIEGLDDTTAYIRIDEFSGNAADEFAECLSLMKERGRENLILDLRTNGGGYLSILQSIAAHLLKDADESYPVVATAQYKSGKVYRYSALAENDYYDYFTEDSKVYLLADENTASASECLIGAMVDYGTLDYSDIYLRASTDGGEASTYGKGIMQSSFASALGVMKLTVATVHWPLSDNCIHGTGVTTTMGAKSVKADLVWGATDTMLQTVIDEVC